MKTFSRRRPAWGLSLLALVCVCATAALPGASTERGPARRALPAQPTETEARVIVKYKTESTLMRALAAGNAATPQHAQALSLRLGLSLRDGRSIGAHAQVVKGHGLSSRELADRLATQPDVEYADVDERKYALAAPNDPLYPGKPSASPATGQWYLRAPTSATIVDPTSVVSAIDAEAAWNITTGNSAIVVAALDTGVRLDHPDLAPKLRPGYDFIRDVAISKDGDGADGDPSDAGDFGCDGETTSSWHGTQTAGLIGAATNNAIGMAGAGHDVMVLPVRVLGCGGGYDSDIQAGMLWAAGLSTTPSLNPYPAKVVNLSLGSTAACLRSYQDVIAQLNRAGVIVVAAAGNDGLKVGSPASCPGAIAVAGVRHAGTKVGYSDLGPEIAIAAPAGNCVNLGGACLFPLLTTSNSGTTTPVADAAGGSIYTGDGGNASLGTSFSAPLVSATVGLMLSVNPTLTPAQVLAQLKSTARPFPATGAGADVAACTAPTATVQDTECYCTTGTCGAGMLDAGKAVAAAAAASADIGVASTSVTVGAPVTLDGSASRATFGTMISTYLWEISSGPATFTGATNAASATLLPSAVGSVVVKLTITDSAGKSASDSVTLTVSAPSSGGGGGALAWGWLLGWLAATLLVAAVTPRGGRRRD
jgi:serine protease